MPMTVEEFYEHELKGKTAPEVLSVIRSQKIAIGKLTRYMEESTLYFMSFPPLILYQELAAYRSCLAKAIETYEALGESYHYSYAALKAQRFNASLPFIKEIHLRVNKAATSERHDNFLLSFDGKDFHYAYAEELYLYDRKYIDNTPDKPLSRDNMLEYLANLHMGEWRRHYSLDDYPDLDRDSLPWSSARVWDMRVVFSNEHRRVHFNGIYAFPYHFGNLLYLLNAQGLIDPLFDPKDPSTDTWTY